MNDSLNDIIYNRSLYPGRFQPFHLGHLNSIKNVLCSCSEVIIMIGSALQSHSLKNPFTAGERISMIKLAMNEVNIDPTRYYIIPVTDLKIHSIWIAHVKSLVPTFDIVYSNEPLTRRLFLEANFPVKSIPFYKRDLYSSTEIRKRMILDKNWQELLPTSVAQYIKEINGIKRLKDLAKTDKLH